MARVRYLNAMMIYWPEIETYFFATLDHPKFGQLSILLSPLLWTLCTLKSE